MVSVDGFRLALRREPCLERIDGGAFRFVAPGSPSARWKICEDSDDLMTIIPRASAT